MKKPYNGHESWNAWNVSLWISNDEGLYNTAPSCIRTPRKNGRPVTAYVATRRFLAQIGPDNKTPDGARFSSRSTWLAIQSLMEDEVTA